MERRVEERIIPERMDATGIGLCATAAARQRGPRTEGTAKGIYSSYWPRLSPTPSVTS